MRKRRATDAQIKANALARSRRYYWKNKEKENARTKIWREANKERHTKLSVESQKRITEDLKRNNPKKYMIKRIRGQAKDRGIEFNITVDDFEIPEFCPILGYKLEINEGQPKANSPSLDRVDNSKGYIPGNVRVISHRANSLKSSLTKEQIQKMLDYVLS